MRVTANSLATDKPVALKFRIEFRNSEMLIFEERGKPELAMSLPMKVPLFANRSIW